MKPAHQRRSGQSALFLLLLLAIASSIIYIYHLPAATSTLTQLTALTQQPISCPLLHLHLPTIHSPPQTPCCVHILSSETPSQTTFPSKTPSCHILRLPIHIANTTHSALRISLPLLQARYDYNWLLLPVPSVFLCPTLLHHRLSDYDPRSRVYLYPLQTPRNHTAPPLALHAQPVPKQPSPKILSRAAVACLSSHLTRAQTLQNPQLPPESTLDNLLSTWALKTKPVIATLNHVSYAASASCQRVPPFPIVSDLPTSEPLAKANLSAAPPPALLCRDRTRPICFPSPTPGPTISEISVLILPQAAKPDLDPASVYNSIRAILPFNELIFADITESRDVSNMLATHIAADKFASILHTFPVVNADVRNMLVAAATKPYVLFLTDVHLLSWETRLGLMLRPLASGEIDLAGGYLIRGEKNRYQGRVGEEQIATETTIAYRYGFHSEIMLRRERVQIVQLDDRDYFRVHRTSDFLMARRETLVRNEWRARFGELAHDEFFVRIMRRGVKVALCHSAVRHRWDLEPAMRLKPERNWTQVKEDARRLCRAWLGELGDVHGLAMHDQEFDCDKRRFCERAEVDGGDGTQFENRWTCHSW